MSGCNYEQEQIRTALHAQARSFDPPTDLKQQIDARLACQKKKEVIPMKHRNMKKIAAVAAVACMLTGTVCVAAVRHSGFYFSGTSSEFNEIHSFSELAKLEKQTGIRTNAIETPGNGFTFASANVVDTNATDESFENIIDSFREISILYEKDDQQLWYSVQEKPHQFSESELARHQVIEADGITYYYNQADYLFVPDDNYEPTAEEKARQAAGELFISSGSSQREEQVHHSLSWNVNGQGYMLSGMDLTLSADDLLAIAAQMQ